MCDEMLPVSLVAEVIFAPEIFTTEPAKRRRGQINSRSKDHYRTKEGKIEK
jgi:hypothetical protein